jgi:hypothetical protein
MALTRGAKVKAAIAVVVGIPGTVLFTPLLSVPLLTGALSLSDSQSAQQGLLFFLWGLSGAIGLVGFWVWVFTRPPISQRRRVLLIVSILAGMCAVFPVTLGANLYVSSLAMLGIVVGLVVCLWLVLPNSPLNPDARDMSAPSDSSAARAG